MPDTGIDIVAAFLPILDSMLAAQGLQLTPLGYQITIGADGGWQITATSTDADLAEHVLRYGERDMREIVGFDRRNAGGQR